MAGGPGLRRAEEAASAAAVAASASVEAPATVRMTAPMTTVPFAAVLLAGGRSRRMGRDKALLPVPGEGAGRLLWERQLEVLRSLEPAELFISGPARPGFPRDVRLLADELPGLGPLSGIVAALEAMTTPLLVVLAVDLPAMNARFLRGLLNGSGQDAGVVPMRRDESGFYEPLAAVYPRGCLEIGRERLRSGELALQGFVCAAGRLLQVHSITAEEEALFTNWNEPV